MEDAGQLGDVADQRPDDEGGGEWQQDPQIGISEKAFCDAGPIGDGKTEGATFVPVPKEPQKKCEPGPKGEKGHNEADAIWDRGDMNRCSAVAPGDELIQNFCPKPALSCAELSGVVATSQDCAYLT